MSQSTTLPPVLQMEKWRKILQVHAAAMMRASVQPHWTAETAARQLEETAALIRSEISTAPDVDPAQPNP